MFLGLRTCNCQPQGSLRDQELSSEAWTRSGQAASPSQQWQCGWLKLGCYPEERRAKAGCPGLPGALRLLPSYLYMHYLLSAIPPPLSSAHRPKPPACLHHTDGEAEAWREWNRPSRTASQQQNQNRDPAWVLFSVPTACCLCISLLQSRRRQSKPSRPSW